MPNSARSGFLKRNKEFKAFVPWDAADLCVEIEKLDKWSNDEDAITMSQFAANQGNSLSFYKRQRECSEVYHEAWEAAKTRLAARRELLRLFDGKFPGGALVDKTMGYYNSEYKDYFKELDDKSQQETEVKINLVNYAEEKNG